MKQNELQTLKNPQQIIYADIVLSSEETSALAGVMHEICSRLDWVETSPVWLDVILAPYFHVYAALCHDPYMKRFANIIRVFYILRSQLSIQISDQQISTALFHYFLATAEPIHDTQLQMLKQQLQGEAYE